MVARVSRLLYKKSLLEKSMNVYPKYNRCFKPQPKFTYFSQTLATVWNLNKIGLFFGS